MDTKTGAIIWLEGQNSHSWGACSHAGEILILQINKLEQETKECG